MGIASNDSSAIRVAVVGAGLSGCEAAWQAASRGAEVKLYEMRPVKSSPAHRGDDFAELVCSNSLRSNQLANAVGLLKEEMRRLGSVVIESADETSVPAGRALAVDRDAFSRRITDLLESHPRIEVCRHPITQVSELSEEFDARIIATGPLTSSELAQDLLSIIGGEYLYFYDAISPVVYADSLDHNIVYRASRYEDGDGDYLNVSLNRCQYRRLVEDLIEADAVPLHHFERDLFFEGCLPIEEMARRGPETLAYGPLKPVGIRDPLTQKRPYGVLQLRQEDKVGALYNLVGFQTKLRIGEQRRIIRGLPGMSKAVFARYGSVHRNTYIDSPNILSPYLEVNCCPGLFITGQLAGVEGYVESAALGYLAGVNVVFRGFGIEPPVPSPNTAHGALLSHLAGNSVGHYLPMNINFGLFPPLSNSNLKISRQERRQYITERALGDLASYATRLEAT